MQEIVQISVFLVFCAIAVALLVWAEIGSAKAKAKEDAELQEEIKNFPVDLQIRLWSAKMRHDAERDCL